MKVSDIEITPREGDGKIRLVARPICVVGSSYSPSSGFSSRSIQAVVPFRRWNESQRDRASRTVCKFEG
jgi:hypothetical protein